MEKIHEKSYDEMYAIYTNFENEEKNNKGLYSLIIGCPANSLDNVAEGFISTAIPESSYGVFQSEAGKPQKIVETWTKIWKLSEKNAIFDKKRTWPLQ